MNFISKDEIRVVFERVKAWVLEGLGGKLDASRDSTGYALANTTGMYDAPNDEAYYLPGSDGALDADADDDHIFAMKGYVDTQVANKASGFNGSVVSLMVSSDTMIADSDTTGFVRMYGPSPRTLTLPQPSAGRVIIIANDSASTSHTIRTGSSSVKIKNLGDAVSAGTQSITLAPMKAIMIVAYGSNVAFLRIDLN